MIKKIYFGLMSALLLLLAINAYLLKYKNIWKLIVSAILIIIMIYVYFRQKKLEILAKEEKKNE